METPICRECGVPMDDYSRPQRPYFICPECGGDDSGVEVEWCDCGEPLIDGCCDCGQSEESEG